MDDILKRIIEIEDRAQSIVRDAKEHKRNFSEEIEIEAQKMKKDIEERAERKIRQIQIQEDEYKQKKLEEIKKETSEKLNKMNQLYEMNRDKWVDAVFEMIMR